MSLESNFWFNVFLDKISSSMQKYQENIHVFIVWKKHDYFYRKPYFIDVKLNDEQRKVCLRKLTIVFNSIINAICVHFTQMCIIKIGQLFPEKGTLFPVSSVDLNAESTC